MISGKEFRELRKNKGLTLKDVAKVLNTSEQAVNKYELEIVRNIPLERIEAMAKLYGVSPAYIMGWNDESSSSVAQQAAPAADPREEKLLSVFRELNDIGKRRAIENVEDLAGNEKYTNQSDSKVAL